MIKELDVVKLKTGEVVAIVAFIGGNNFYAETKNSELRQISTDDVAEVLSRIK